MKFTDYRPIFYPESRFGGYTDIDGSMAFYLRINALIQPDFTVVDLGCGRGANAQTEDPIPLRKNLRIIKGKVKKVIGIDVDPVGHENPSIDEFRLIEPGKPWPLENASVDLIFSDLVLEHVEDPEMYFSEVERVLAPGGYLCLRTTNLNGYVAIANKIIPEKYHDRILQSAYAKYQPCDKFPAVYRCNTPRALRNMIA